MNRFSTLTTALLVLTTLALPDSAEGSDAQRIDVLVYYTSAAAAHYDGEPATRVRHLVAVANDVFERSGLAGRLHLAGIEATEYAGAERAPVALKDITYGQDPAFEVVSGRRAEVGADVVILMGTYLYDGYCGVAWQGGTEEPGRLSDADRAHAYAYVAMDCSVYTLVHELGHLLGLAHSRLETPEAGTRPWAVGHGMEAEFTTIMATPGAFNAPRLPYFSSPDLHACLGHACGVTDTDPEHGAHAVKALGETLPQFAAYMPEEDGEGSDTVAEMEQQRVTAADTDAIKMSDPDADEAPEAATDVSDGAVATSGQGKPKSGTSSNATSTQNDSTASTSQTSSAPASSTAQASSSSSGGGGGGCAMGAAHDDISLPFLLLASLVWLLRRRLIGRLAAVV